MADIIDAQNALVGLIAPVLYPNGTGQPSAVVVSGASVPCMVYPGWPVPAQLDADLAAGKAHISVFPTPSERNTTRYPKTWQQLSMNPATLTLTISGQQVTVGGSVPSPFTTQSAQNMALVVGGKSYVYSVQAADTLTSIATALAALAAVDWPGTTNNAAVITFPVGAVPQTARVGVTGTVFREIRRQERVFQITIWASSPVIRDAIAALVDPVLAQTQFLTLADTTAARLIYKGSPVTDAGQKERLYRRDLLYTVEYATIQTQAAAEVVASQNNVSNQPTGATAPISTVQINL